MPCTCTVWLAVSIYLSIFCMRSDVCCIFNIPIQCHVRFIHRTLADERTSFFQTIAAANIFVAVFHRSQWPPWYKWSNISCTNFGILKHQVILLLLERLLKHFWLELIWNFLLFIIANHSVNSSWAFSYMIVAYSVEQAGKMVTGMSERAHLIFLIKRGKNGIINKHDMHLLRMYLKWSACCEYFVTAAHRIQQC